MRFAADFGPKFLKIFRGRKILRPESREIAPKSVSLCVGNSQAQLRGLIVAENGKPITVSPSESVFHGSESVSETVNRSRFNV